MRRAVLIPACVNFDLDYAVESVRPGTSPPQRAFQLVACGYDMLLATAASPRAFPTRRATNRWRGSRAVWAKLLWQGLDASIFLANAVPVLMARTEGKLGDNGEDANLVPTDPAYHLALRGRVQDFYPLSSEDKLFLHGCLAEFRVMGNREPRQEVLEGKQPAMPYSQALMRGDNPDEDPRLVSEQKRYARDYFINQAIIAATKIAMEYKSGRRGTWKFFMDKVVDIAEQGDDARTRAFRARFLRAWMAGNGAYRNYVLMYDAPLVAELGTAA